MGGMELTETRIRRLVSVEDYQMRDAIFSDFFTQLSCDALSSLMEHLDKGIRQQSPDARTIVHSLFIYWTKHWAKSIERLASLSNSALTVNLRFQTQFDAMEAWKLIASDENMFPDDAVLTLGERRSRARMPSRKTIETYLFDPDALVAKHILQNPMIRQEDVIRMAARRPMTAEALTAVFKSRRFGTAKPIMLALLQNPFLPYQVGLGLVFLMPRQDLKVLRGVQSLSPTLKQYIKRRFDHLSGN